MDFAGPETAAAAIGTRGGRFVAAAGEIAEALLELAIDGLDRGAADIEFLADLIEAAFLSAEEA